MPPSSREASLNAEFTSTGTLRIVLGGDWVLERLLPRPDEILARLAASPRPGAVEVDGSALGRWDTGLVTTLLAIERAASAAGLSTTAAHLPAGAQRLLRLALAVKERAGTRQAAHRPALLREDRHFCHRIPAERHRSCRIFRRVPAFDRPTATRRVLISALRARCDDAGGGRGGAAHR